MRKSGASFRDQNEIRRLDSLGFSAEDIAKSLKIYDEVVKRFMPSLAEATPEPEAVPTAAPEPPAPPVVEAPPEEEPPALRRRRRAAADT